MPVGRKAKQFLFPYQFVLAFRSETTWQYTHVGRRFVFVTKTGKKKSDVKWSQETNWTGDQRVVKAVKGSVPDSEDSF